MKLARASGILLHPTSLPGPFGIGDLGPSAHAFVEFLAAAGQRLWQVLPLGPTGYGNSPYSAYSSHAGNPLLISPEAIVQAGHLHYLPTPPSTDPARADYLQALSYKQLLLHEAAERGIARERSSYDSFCAEHDSWLPDFALFMAAKEAHGGLAWTDWEPALRDRDPAALSHWRGKLAPAIAVHQYGQWMFFRQWHHLRQACRQHGIRIIGDIPIYVAHDSADVWTRRDLFTLNAHGRPIAVSGVPPDYFSADGQLWGNPLYRWDVLEQEGYRWWIERLRSTFQQVDLVRMDHFRGFEAYWEVPMPATTAAHGRWTPGPGAKFFAAAQQALGPLPIIAEDLGLITPPVEALRHQFGFPGMSVLQFAFGSDPQAADFRPHNYPREIVAYSGTHDNDTTVGWWQSAGTSDSTRSAEQVERERAIARAYLRTDGSDIHWVFIRTLMASVADTVIVPLQDVMGLGNEARMNRPATAEGNWDWRCTALPMEAARQLRELSVIYERAGGDVSWTVPV